MKLAYVSALLTLPLFSGCRTADYLEIPERGKISQEIPTERNAFGHVLLVIPPETKEIRYNGFKIRNPHEPAFLVYVARNSANHAEWNADLQHSGYEFLASVVREQIPFMIKTPEELQAQYEKSGNRKRSVIRFDTDIVEREGMRVVRFRERAREPETGRLILTEGFAAMDPDEPDFVIEAKYLRCAYENEIDFPKAKELGELFLNSVEIPLPSPDTE